MSGVEYYLALVQQTRLVMAHFFPVTLLLAGGLAASWVWWAVTPRAGPRRTRWRLFCLGCLTPFVTPTLVLLVGVVFAHDSARAGGAPAPAYPVHLLLALLFTHVTLAVLLIRMWKDLWPAILASSVFTGYVSLCAAFISSMSVTGEWL